MLKMPFLVYNKLAPSRQERPLRWSKPISGLSRQRYRLLFITEKHPSKHSMKQSVSISNHRRKKATIGYTLIVLAWKAIKGHASGAFTIQKTLKPLSFSHR